MVLVESIRQFLEGESVVEIPIPVCDWPGCDNTTGSTTRVRCDEHASLSADRAPMIGPGRIPQT